jgi:hypothetical protein
LVLDVEDRLTFLDKDIESWALAVLPALLVDLAVH